MTMDQKLDAAQQWLVTNGWIPMYSNRICKAGDVTGFVNCDGDLAEILQDTCRLRVIGPMSQEESLAWHRAIDQTTTGILHAYKCEVLPD